LVVLNYLLAILFIVFGFGELFRIQLPIAAGLGLVDIVIGLIVLVWLTVRKKKKFFLRTSILFFIAACLISIVVNLGKFEMSQVMVGSLYLLRWVLYAGLYFVISDIGKKFSRRISIYMFISGLIVLTVGFFQFFLYPSLKNLYYLGWDDHMYRLFSSFLDPNFSGTFFVLFLIFIFVIKEIYKSQKKLYYSLHLLMVVDFIAIVLTYSRSAFLMLLVSTLVYCVIKKNYKILAGLIGIFVLVVIILSPRFYLVNNNLFRIPSLEQRVLNIGEALSIYKENPLFGVGFNNMRYAREKYGFRDTTPWGFSHSGGGADSSFALILTTAGIPGILAYIFLLYKIFRLGRDYLIKSPFALILVLSVVGLMANSLLLNSLFYSFIMIWLWVLAGLTESSGITANNSRE
jgi:hypothetical protein